MTMKIGVSKLLVLLLIAIFILSTANMVKGVGVTATIPVGNAPSGAAYDSSKSEIFVANGQDNTTSVISDSTNTVVSTIPVGGYPYGVAYDSALSEIYVVNLYSNSVSVISDNTNTVIATIPVGVSPYNIVYDPAKSELFVANQYDSTVSVISDKTNTVVATITVGTDPFGIAYDSGKSEIFVVNTSPDTKDYSLSIISDNTNTVVATVSLPGSPQFIVYDSGKGEIFVTTSAVITVISDNNNAVVATISDLNFEVQVDGLIYDSGSNQVFVALHQSNEVTVISDSTNKVVQTIPVGHLPWVGTYDPGNGAIYVTNGGDSTVSVISGPPTTSTTSTTPNSNPGSTNFGSILWLIIIIIIIILLIIIIFIWLSRQRKFTVTVQNTQTQTPISGANVIASGQQDLSGTTNKQGQTVFNDFKDGDYSIKANATGYNPSTPISVSVKNKTEVSINLKPSLSEESKADNTGNGHDGEDKSNSKTPNIVVQESNNQTQPRQTIQQPKVQLVDETAQGTPPSFSQQEASEQQGWSQDRINQNIKKFQEKGAISPETAMTAKELGLSRIFIRFMERRKGQTKLFKEVNGKYYLDQEALEERKQ